MRTYLLAVALVFGSLYPASAQTAVFAGIDRTLGKSWQGTYGSNGYACWPDGGGTPGFPTTFVRGAGSQYRFTGFGVCQGFYNRTADGVAFRIGLAITTPQTLRFRMCDLPAGAFTSPRVTKIDVYADSGIDVVEPGSLGQPHANGALLDSRLIDHFESCVYPGWVIQQPTIFQFTAIEPHLYQDGRLITDTNGLAVFSGMFLDPPAQAPPPPPPPPLPPPKFPAGVPLTFVADHDGLRMDGLPTVVGGDCFIDPDPNVPATTPTGTRVFAVRTTTGFTCALPGLAVGAHSVFLLVTNNVGSVPSAMVTFEITGLSPVDCLLSDWSAWSAWIATGAQETRTRTRTVVTPASNGGLACGPLSESETRPIPPPTKPTKLRIVLTTDVVCTTQPDGSLDCVTP